MQCQTFFKNSILKFVIALKLKCVTFLVTFKLSANKETTDEELEEMLETGNVAVFTGDVSFAILSFLQAKKTACEKIWFFFIFLQIVVQTQEARQALADIEARHEEIINLEKNIRELRDLFIEMASLVETQVNMQNI
jgi:syntaxin 1A